MINKKLPWFFSLCMFLCLILGMAGWGLGFLGLQIVFESARLQGVTLLLWIALAWGCLLMCVIYCRLWVKLVFPALVIVPLFFVTLFGISDGEDLVRTGEDRSINVMQRTAVDFRTTRVMYDFNAGPMCWGGLMERTEISLLPGILLIYNPHRVYG
jgi:hypothetical protein